jgi:hypothetical protein
MAVNPPRPQPSPSSGVVGRLARPAGCQLTHNPPRPPTSLVSPTSTWASVVRGGTCASVDGPACPTPQPAVSTADFSALYKHCLASGLKARLVFNHAAGLQVVTVSCSLPTTTTIPTTAGKRCRRCRHRQRRGRAAIVGAVSDRSPSTATAAPAAETTAGDNACTPTPEVAPPTPPSLQQSTSPLPSPEIITPPAKRTRRRRNKVELLCGSGDESEFLLSPLPCTPLPPSSSLSSPSRSQKSSPASPSSTASPPSTASLPVSPHVLLYLEPVPLASGPPAPPTLPASPPPAEAPPAGAAPARPSSSSPPPGLRLHLQHHPRRRLRCRPRISLLQTPSLPHPRCLSICQ